ncbi:MAG: D-alanine--D-alanine ligase A [Burkholderiales bacterium RIFCSPHIGHO2_12_FULL_61_11]|nr:MAG: D-alanine--D-alanine ligase A [Burkholderiales bacterium RIFCSPHIGHO2_12_FULL_61_11]
MKPAPVNICILYGGKSGEHEVSLKSAASVVKNLDPSKYRVIAIGIDKAGRWHLQETVISTLVPGQGDALTITPYRHQVSVVPSDGIHAATGKLEIDCVFPVLHGNFGEDGTLQGLLEQANLPYVGAGVLGSAASMDKATSKCLWRDAGLPIVDFELIHRANSLEERQTAGNSLGWPLFVKPCASGSSLGASRVNHARELDAAIEQALQFDARVLLERYVDSREIECAVIGNAVPQAYAPGEVVPGNTHSFYDYDAKYTDPDGAKLVAVASLDATTRANIMHTAEAAYAAVRCEGMARIDFFLERNTGALFLNEINTIPGFTNISMFPRMCEASGLAYPELLDKLITLALQRDADNKGLRYQQ